MQNQVDLDSEKFCLYNNNYWVPALGVSVLPLKEFIKKYKGIKHLSNLTPQH